MSQFVIPSGFELVTFAWEDLSALTVASACVAVLQTGLVAQPRLSPATSVECTRMEEDMERWDGLS